MSRITGVIVALATAAAVLTGSTVGAEPAPAAPPAAELPKEIPGGVELTLADGDLLRVWAADNYRAVFSRRLDAATGAWGPRLEVLRRRNLYCGEVEGRTANGAVALLAQCDEGGYYEDTAPVSSQAMWSPDGVTWTSYTLDGEAYEEPGISPDGQNAVWPMHQRYTTRTAAGWTDHSLRADGQEYSVTATITDTAQVSFVYGTCSGRPSRLVGADAHRGCRTDPAGGPGPLLLHRGRPRQRRLRHRLAGHSRRARGSGGRLPPGRRVPLGRHAHRTRRRTRALPDVARPRPAVRHRAGPSALRSRVQEPSPCAGPVLRPGGAGVAPAHDGVLRT